MNDVYMEPIVERKNKRKGKKRKECSACGTDRGKRYGGVGQRK